MQTDLAARLEELAGRVTPGPWQGYSEPDVNLPYSLFAGTPMQSGFGPIEPLGALDIDLICLLRNNLPDIIAALRAGKWQPIETAPRNGNDVLMLAYQHPNHGWIMKTGRWVGDRWYSNVHSVGHPMTHWLAISTPPAKEAPND